MTTDATPNASQEDTTAMLLAFLKDHDAACPTCDYNLRGLTRPVCPECAEPLALGVRATRSNLPLLILALAPGIFSGIAAFLLFAGIIWGTILNGPPPVIWPYLIDLFGFASAAFAIFLYRRRRRFYVLPFRNRVTAIALIWLVHVLAFVIVVVLIPK